VESFVRRSHLDQNASKHSGQTLRDATDDAVDKDIAPEVGYVEEGQPVGYYAKRLDSGVYGQCAARVR